jgi:ribosomal protein L11 methylase PrmA
VPYRIDVPGGFDMRIAPGDALDRLVDLGALDVESLAGGLAAIIPDGVSPAAVAAALRLSHVTVSAAVGRDGGSVWRLCPPVVRIGRIEIAPPGVLAGPDAIRLTDSPAFGSGLHPTTALCIEVLDAALASGIPARLLDVGTGSGVLAIIALVLGVPQAVGLDVDAGALRVAAQNAILNGVSDRLQLVLGGPAVVTGTWPVVVANVLAAPLIEMASVLVRRVGHHGRLMLSGIPRGVVSDVERAYVRLGMRTVGSETRAGWTVLVLQASW